MYDRLIKHQSGYALPMAMAVSLIIILINTTILGSVREKVKVSLELNDRGTAYVEAYSAMNDVIYNLLCSTNKPYSVTVHKRDGSTLEWNLFGEPIILTEGVRVRLRDLSGMISPLFNPTGFGKLVEYVSEDAKTSSVYMDALLDWQDSDDLKRLNGAESYDYRKSGVDYTPRNYYIQVPQEMQLLEGLDQGIYKRIENDLVYWTGGHTNYLTMSEETLCALLKNDSLVKTIVDLRKEGRLTGRIFSDMTGIPETESHVFRPSAWLKVEIIAQVGKTLERIDAVMVNRQTDISPFAWVEWRK